MKIFESHSTLSALHHRALSLAISKDFAQAENGNIADKLQESEQANRRRELLAVEQLAQKNKIIEAHGESHFKSQVAEKLFARVNSQVNADLSDHQYIFNDVLGIEVAAADLLEILAVKAASIKRIAPIVRSLPWLGNEVVKLVNKPQYRKRADVQMSDPNLALSYIGLDNLKQVMPIFMLKNWLPTSTSPLPLMKRKLWNDSLAVAMATKVLAQHHGSDEFTAYVAGMFCNLGYYAVTRNVLTTFNDFHLDEMKVAYDNKDKKLHGILAKMPAPEKVLHQQLIDHSATITAELIDMMPFERIRITEAMFDLANTSQVTKMCPLARLLFKARSYIMFRSLAKEELINHDDTKLLLSAAKLTPVELALLKKSDIDHIKLNFR